MGISGLLPLLDKCTRRCHVSEFRGCTVAIDTYCWLHKGATSCAEQLAKGQQTDMYITYCLKYVKLLLSYGINPIMVFDGKNLPAKADTELKRRKTRSNAKQRAAELLCLGKNDEARTYLKQCIDITPEMANALMRECRKLNVDCIVAPYESDAQLAFFNIKGIADFIISEDSDLILFGCKKVLYKMDLTGNGQLVETEKLYLAFNMRPDQFNFNKFLYMCILSGCDYLESLPGIGLKKALKFIRLTAETNPELFLDKLPRYLNMRHLVVNSEYKERFLVAEATFRHQTVFDPFKRKLVPLTDPMIHGTKPEYCRNAGDIYDEDLALEIALGNRHPNNLKKIDDWSPPYNVAGSSSNALSHSIWSGSYKKPVSRAEAKRISEAKKQNQLKPENKENIQKLQQIEEIVKQTYDSRLETELTIYSVKKINLEDDTKQTAKVESEVEQETLASSIQPEVKSPVISKNPFLAKRKLSKFQSTSVERKDIVRSRFFSSKSEQSVNVPDKIDEVNEIAVLSLQEPQSSESPAENPTEKAKVSRKRPFDECERDEHGEIVDLTDAEVKQQPLQVTAKRKNTGSCRQIGLSKRKSQPTLLDMFQKMNKS